jgi:hypothetical protein
LLGEIRWVDSYYLQGWLATKLEDAGVQALLGGQIQNWRAQAAAVAILEHTH